MHEAKFTFKELLLRLPFFRNIVVRLNNQYERDYFVQSELHKLTDGKIILDAGCGSQRYRQYCNHLIYKAQDFGKYKNDDKKMFGKLDSGGTNGYQYGKLDYIGDICAINESDGYFDAILCTEVLEHIKNPIQAIHEFSRLLKKNGVLILTAPSNCLRHMDPYFFYSGFSDRWYESWLAECGFTIEYIEPVGDYYLWMAVEIARTITQHGIISKILLFPAFLYYYFKMKSTVSVNTLCMGYHVVARKVR